MTNASPEKVQKCLITTLGMLVLDEIHFPSQPPKTDIIGGSGAWFCLGARLFSPDSNSSKLGWMIRTGDNFPDTARKLLQRWEIQLLEYHVTGQQSTRGELIYHDTTFGPKTFRYTTAPLKIEPKHLLGTPLLSADYFHMLASPEDTKDQIHELLQLRKSSGIVEKPVIIWEPSPPSCFPDNLHSCLEAIKLVDVFSPNHIELGALFSIDLRSEDHFDKSIIEDLARKCLESGIGAGNQGTVIVRAGHEGCYLYSRQRKEFVWLPAYYESKSSKVVDPTGAGNAFLGGFALGMIETGDDVVASCYGNVAASFAIEQIGLPELETKNYGVEEGWNGVNVRERLREHTKRLGISLLDGFGFDASTLKH